MNPLEMYHATSGALVREFDGASGGARPYVDQTGHVLMSVGKDLKVRTWDVRSGQLKNEFSFKPGLRNATVGPKGHQVAMFHDQNVTLWDTRKKHVTTLLTPDRLVNTLVFSEDGDRLYVGSNRAKLTLFDIKSEREIKRFNGHFGPITGVAISPDEKQLVSSDFAGRVIVWDIENAQPLVTLSDAKQHVNDASSVAWSPDNKRIAVGRLVQDAAVATGRRVVFISSCALSHKVVRGPELWPSEEMQALDHRLVDLMRAGKAGELVAWAAEYCAETVAEMGGRTICGMIGAMDAMDKASGPLEGRQYGPYAQSGASASASSSRSCLVSTTCTWTSRSDVGLPRRSPWRPSSRTRNSGA